MRFLLPLLALFALDAHAQRLLDRGTIQLGGAAGYASLGGDLHVNVDGSRDGAIVIDPKFGFFLFDRFAAGTTLTYERTSSDASSSSILTVAPLVTYYFARSPRALLPFVTASAGYSYARTDFAVREDLEQDAFEFRASGVSLGAGLGAAYLVSPRVGITGEAFYQTAFYGSDALLTSPTANRFGLRLGAVVFLF